MTRRLVLLALVALAPSCQVDTCNLGAEAQGPLCFPTNPIAADCGNGVCERLAYVAEDATSCPEDCDAGPQGRAFLLWFVTANFYNDHVAGKSWPMGQVSTSGACDDGGTASASGTAGSIGSQNFHQLTFQASACHQEFSVVGEVTLEGGPFTRTASFDNTADTDQSQFSGSVRMAGREDDVPFGPEDCVLDFTRAVTGTVAVVMGTLCGEPLRTVVYDDR
ncbi:hypothetical protein L6R52_01340 [Myxococcota bacterium]|nr:hypothetical protein [Myxococcota bacterium]